MERLEARRKHLTRYVTGRPCVHGHYSERMTSSGTCCDCLRKTVASNKYRSEEAIRRRKKSAATRRFANEDKYKARMAVGNAIRDGNLFKPDSCPRCDSSLNIEAHHEDYSKPLDVAWLCQKCHQNVHRGK